MNIFQTLIAYEGNGVTGFVPEAATCVPGYSSGQPGNCVSLYGSDLVVDNSTTGAPEYYTFVIGPSHFYDPATGASWQVYPSDVMFSVARSQAFFQILGVGSTGGVDIAQEMLQTSTANVSWDGGIHTPYNNTVQGIMENMYVNSTAFCPATVLAEAAGTFGCITFNVWGGSTTWPFFEEALTQVFGGAPILPCGWYTYESAGLPGFAGTSAAKGDGPCLLPGGATSTDSSTYQRWLSTTSPTAWDAVDYSMFNYPAPDPNVQWKVVGSGPYYEVPGGLSPGVSYQLEANPAFAQSAFCASTPTPGCQPAAGTYISHIFVYWEPSDEVGLQEFASGQADLATIESNGTSTLLSLASDGELQYMSFPALTILFWAFDLNTSISGLQSVLPSGSVVNVPSTFFTGLATRQLLVNAWPYGAANDTINTIDGVSYGLNYGGVIPYGEGNYYPLNISWPAGDPTNSSYPAGNPTQVGSAAWWWAQGTNASSVYYDSELAACTTNDPCIFPFIGQTGDPELDQVITQWISDVQAITHDALQPYDYDVSPATAIIDSVTNPPGQNPLNLYTLGWVPDYPDPSDNVATVALANGTYTVGNALYNQLTENAAVSSLTCPDYGATTSFAALIAYANMGEVPESCQGVAFTIANYWGEYATHVANITQRELDYNLFEHVLNELALYLYYQQPEMVEASAPWINESSLNVNPIIGGSQDNYFFQIQIGPEYSVTFTQASLPLQTSWSVTLNGVKATSTSSEVTFREPNGSYSFTVNAVPSYTSNLSSGQLTVNGSSVSETVTFTPAPPTRYDVTFTESNLPSGTFWSVTFNGTSGSTNAPASISFSGYVNDSYPFQIAGVAGYQANPTSGTLKVDGSSLSEAIAFTALPPSEYTVTFTESGLPSGTSWSVTFNGTSASASVPASITFSGQVNDSYTYQVAGVPGYRASPASGSVTINGSSASEAITFSLLPTARYNTTFNETGLPSGTAWSVTFDGTSGSASAPTSITFSGYVNDSYTFQVAGVAGYRATPPSGSVVVNGSSLNETIAFTPLPPGEYSVTFTESGLPSGTSWSVTFNGTSESASAPSSLVFSGYQNATYTFSVAASGAWLVLVGGSGSVTVNGAGPTVALSFEYTYIATFSQSGIPSGVEWTLQVTLLTTTPSTPLAAGESWFVNSTGASATLPLANGTYSYTLTASGYKTVTGSFGLNGAPANVPTVTSKTTTTTSSIPSWVWIAVGVVAAVIVVAMVAVLSIRKPRPPVAGDPPTPSSPG